MNSTAQRSCLTLNKSLACNQEREREALLVSEFLDTALIRMHVAFLVTGGMTSVAVPAVQLVRAQYDIAASHAALSTHQNRLAPLLGMNKTLTTEA
jgi:hypothetical protein